MNAGGAAQLQVSRHFLRQPARRLVYDASTEFSRAPGPGSAMEFLKSTAGKILTAALALAVIGGGILWWQTDPASREAILSGIGRSVAWFLGVLLLPWASFLLIGRVAKADTNAAGVALVVGLTAGEALVLAWLFGWNFGGALAWTFAVAAVLFASVYNLFTCDWIAEKVA